MLNGNNRKKIQKFKNSTLKKINDRKTRENRNSSNGAQHAIPQRQTLKAFSER